MFDVSVGIDSSVARKTGKETIHVAMSDFSGHGKEYIATVSAGTGPSLLSAGVLLTSTEDKGTITFKQEGNVAEVTGEIPAKLQCLDLQSDNPTGAQ